LIIAFGANQLLFESHSNKEVMLSADFDISFCTAAVPTHTHTHTHAHYVSESKRYSRQFSSSLLSEQSSSSSHLHMVGIHLMLLHWNCPSSHSVSVPVSVPENNSEENYICSSTQTTQTCNH